MCFDKLGNEVQPSKLSTYVVSSKLKQFGDKNLRGLISENGEIVLPPIYNDVYSIKIGNSQFHITGQTDGRVGVFHARKWLVPCEYDKIVRSKAYPFFAALRGDSTEIVDTLGKTVSVLPFPINYENGVYINKKQFWHPQKGLVRLPNNTASIVSYGSAIIVKSYAGLFSLLNGDGHEIFKDYHEITSTKEWSDKIGYFYFLRKNGLWGMTDHSFRHGFAPIYPELSSLGYGNFIARKDFLYGVVNYKGEQVMPFEFEESAYYTGFLALKKDGKWGIFDKRTFKVISDFEFDEIGASRTSFFVGKTNGLYSIYDGEGKLLNDEAFSKQPHFFDEGGFSFGEDNQLAFYSSDGVRRTAHIFSTIRYLDYPFSDKFRIVATLSKGGQVYLDATGCEALRADGLILRGNSFVAAYFKDFWQFMDEEGNLLSELRLRSLLIFHKYDGWGTLYVGQDTNNVWHVVDILGKSVHQFEAEEVGHNGGDYNLSHFYYSKEGKRYIFGMPGFVEKELKYDNGEEGPVSLRGKHGYVDRSGKEVIPCEYDEIIKPGEKKFEKSRLLAAKKRGVYDVYDSHSAEKLLVGVQSFSKIGLPSRVFYTKSGHTGYINPESGEIGEGVYSMLFHQGVGGVSFYIVKYRNSDSYGLLNRHLEQVLAPQYKEIRAMEVGQLFVADYEGNQWVFDGKSLIPIGRGIRLAKVLGDKLLVRETDKFRLTTFDGKRIKDIEGETMEWHFDIGDGEYAMRIKSGGKAFIHFTDARAAVGPIQEMKQQVSPNYLLRLGDKWGLYNLSVGFLAKPVYDTIQEQKDFGYAVRKGKKWGFLSFAGHVTLRPVFDIKPVAKGHYFIVRKDGKFQYLDVFGKPIFTERYDYAHAFSAGLAPVCRNGKWGYIDMKGKQIIPFQYDYAHPFYAYYEVAWVMVGDSTRFIDLAGNVVMNPPRDAKAKDSGWIYDPTLLWPADQQARTVKIKNTLHYAIFFDTIRQRYGIVSYNGKIILEPEASAADWIDNNKVALAWYLKDGKYGFITSSRQLIPAEYDKYERLDYSSLRLYKGEKRYFLQPNGELVPSRQ